MLFTREELVEMGLLNPELPSNPREVLGELLSNSYKFNEVASQRLPDCQKVAKVSEAVATDLTPLFIYIYLSRLLGCYLIKEVEGEYIVKYRVETYVSPYNPSNLPDLEIFVSLWDRYSCADFVEVATSDPTQQPELVEQFVKVVESSSVGGLIKQDWAFYKRFGHLPGDAWDGVITDDGLTLDIFEAKEARLITDLEVLESAVVERQRVRPGRTMLSLMYEHNVGQFTWFEGHGGQWHCYNNEGLS